MRIQYTPNDMLHVVEHDTRVVLLPIRDTCTSARLRIASPYHASYYGERGNIGINRNRNNGCYYVWTSLGGSLGRKSHDSYYAALCNLASVMCKAQQRYKRDHNISAIDPIS